MAKRYNFNYRKSIHIHLQTGTHAEFRKKLFGLGLTMQEVFEECAEKIVSGEKWTERLLDDCVIKKNTGERKIALADAENIYQIIESEDEDGRD